MSRTEIETVPAASRRTSTTLTFYFDPLCPWTWRTAQWIREVQSRQPLDVQWRFFSLAAANNLDPSFSIPLQVLALAGRQGGNEAVGRLYRALGTVLHERGVDIWAAGALEQAVSDALVEGGFDPYLLQQALDDPSTQAEIIADYEEARTRYGAYGVPWLVLGRSDFGFNGPILTEAPIGQTALQLWEHVSWLLTQPYFYELKRERTQPRAAASTQGGTAARARR